MPETEPTPPILVMRDVTVGTRSDPDVLVVEHVNWEVAPGEYWVIGGLQGSGKSEFLAMAAGLSRPVAGEYRVFGRDLSAESEETVLAIRLRIGLVFGAGGRLFNHLTVAENVALPLRYHQSLTPEHLAQRTRHLLDQLQLSEFAHTLPSVLARNWRQRVALARALATKPEIVLLDNPLAQLDLRHARWWLEFLDALAAGHPLLDGHPATLVVASDDLRPWRNPKACFAVMQEKRWTAVGPRSALAQSGTPLLRELLTTDSAE